MAAAMTVMGGLVATGIGATCDSSFLCPNTLTPGLPDYDNTGCAKGTNAGTSKGFFDVIGEAAGTLTQVRYGDGIQLVDNATGMILAQTGQNNLQCPCTNDDCATDFDNVLIQVGTPTCTCISGSKYLTKITANTNYDVALNKFQDTLTKSSATSTAP
jgi:hypothetical protein